MNIKSLTYFAEVAREKNFTRAANNLHLSQPALSKVIKNLEIELGISLIDRSAKHFKLTNQGEIFFENTKKSLYNINRELDKLYSTINSTKGKLIVGIPPIISTVFFPPIISKFRHKYPDIDFIIIEEGANSIKDKVNESEVDIGIVMLPIEDENLKTIKIISSESVFIVNNQHRLAIKDKVSIKELKNEDFISLDENYMLYDKLKLICKEAGYEPNIVYKSSQWDFIIEMVSYNQSVALLPKPIVDMFKNKNIKGLYIENPEIPWDIGIVIKKDRYLSYAMKEFIKLVQEDIVNSRLS